MDWAPKIQESVLSYYSIESETDKSWLLKLKRNNDQTVSVWVPKSKCELKVNTQEVVIPNWLLKKINKEIKNK
jgi:uncharacterized protein HemX